MHPKPDLWVAEACDVWNDEASAGQLTSNLGEAPGQRVVLRSEAIGELPMRLIVWVAIHQVVQTVSFEEAPEEARSDCWQGTVGFALVQPYAKVENGNVCFVQAIRATKIQSIDRARREALSRQICKV